MSIRKEKVREMIIKNANDFIMLEANNQSLITVTDANVSPDLKRSTIFVSVLPETKEKAVMDFLKRQRSNFKKYFKEKNSISTIPFFDFQLDFGEKARQQIEEISQKL